MLLQESASPTSKAARAGLAVCVVGSPDSAGHLMIYDPSIIYRLVKEYRGAGLPVDYNMVQDSIDENPVVRSGVGWTAEPEPCNGAKVVTKAASVAGSGMGPAAYEAAIWYTGGLASDRLETSQLAGYVWSRYYDRDDVVKSPFDDIDDPKTPPEEDDCHFQDRDFLNYSYSLKTEPPGLRTLEKNHEDCMKFCSGIGIENLPFYLLQLFRMIFQQRMSEDET
jgi:hypothetical protein